MLPFCHGILVVQNCTILQKKNYQWKFYSEFHFTKKTFHPKTPNDRINVIKVLSILVLTSFH